MFDFIRHDVLKSIFERTLSNFIRRVAERDRIALTVDEQVEATLRSRCIADPSRGGRGVGNAFESYFVNPLVRALFDQDVVANDSIRVTEIRRDAGIVSLELDR